MSFTSYTSLIPPQVRWFKDLADFGKGGLLVIPGNEKQRYRPWSDTSTANYTRDYFTGFYQNTTQSRTYDFIVRDSSGYPKMCAIGSKEFYDTYTETGVLNPPNVRVYEQYAYMFPNGVPFTEKTTIYFEKDKLDEPNFKGFKPGWDYPITVHASDMLVVVNGEVATIKAEDFIKLVSVRDFSPEKKLELVQNVLNRTDMVAKDKVSAIHDITIRENITIPVI